MPQGEEDYYREACVFWCEMYFRYTVEYRECSYQGGSCSLNDNGGKLKPDLISIVWMSADENDLTAEH